MSGPSKPYRVVIADESALYRHALRKVINGHPDLEAVAVAQDGQEAVNLIQRLAPDAAILNLDLPKLSGAEVLDRLPPSRSLPVVMVSGKAREDSDPEIIDAIGRAAVELFIRPPASADESLTKVLLPVAEMVHGACRRHRRANTRRGRGRPSTGEDSLQIIAIGASTGGVTAISQIVRRLPGRGPPVVIAQHMPRDYTLTLCQQLVHHSTVQVLESRSGLELSPGHVVVCTSNDRHTVVRRAKSGRLQLDFDDGPTEHHQRPAIDALFRSVAEVAGRRSLGVLLTGMGRDGAEGLLTMRNAGAGTIAESEDTAVVFGMPRAAIECRAAQQVLGLDQIVEELAVRTQSVRSSPLKEVAR